MEWLTVTNVLLFLIACLLFWVVILIGDIYVKLTRCFGDDDHHSAFVSQEIDKIQKHLRKIKEDTIEIKVNTMNI